MTLDEFKRLIVVMRPKMLEEIKKFRTQAHGRLTEQDEEEIVNDTITSLYKNMADLPEADVDLWKRFMSRMHGRFNSFLRHYPNVTIVSLESRPWSTALSLEERLPSFKYAPDRVSERDEREIALLRLMQILRDVPLQPRHRRVVDLVYLDSLGESLDPVGRLLPGAAQRVADLEGITPNAAWQLLLRARVALKKAVLEYLKDTKDPLLHLVEDSKFLFDQSEEQ